ncbi:G-protein coupled receptor moody-like [Acanthaster planci]|uniref:G-protein coupled receptor moody-like n=1 Tax=Acanthaster planci TaxID=133434 RepID=A0A8B7XIP9_ACAPL|nr:G-protein coupled receptor moody-like [Acanthaster planci]
MDEEGVTDTVMDNSTESPTFEFSDYTQRVLVATMFLSAFVVGTVGNSVVLLAVLLSKKLRTTTNAFVVSLSIADLLTCLVIPWDAIALLGRDGLPVGEWVCKVVAIAQATTVGCSLYMLASIGLNRLLLITRASTTYRVIYTPRKIAVWLILAWLLPLLIVLLPPVLDVGAVGFNPKYHICGSISSHPRSNNYDLIIAGTLYPVPLVTIIICYILIWRHLYLHAKKMVGSPEASIDSTDNRLSVVSKSVVTINSIHSHHLPQSPTRSRTVSRSRMSRRQTEITKNMFYIVCAFMLCLTPYAICLFFDDSDPALPYAAAILFINSCVNPFIYATKHPHFKTVFGCIFRRQWDHIPDPSDTLKTLRKRTCCGRSGLYA